MILTTSIFEPVATLLDSGCPFTIFRLPGEGAELWIQTTPRIARFMALSDLPAMPGFVFAPFVISDKTPALFLKPDFILREDHSNPSDVLAKCLIPGSRLQNGRLTQTNKKDYIQNLKALIGILKSGVSEKVVISRTTAIKRISNQHLSNLFFALCDKYPASFVSLVHFPPYGTWMGSSPETLISSHGNNFRTMALAGTKPVGSNNQWGEKEREEQAIVSRYIHDKLLKYQVQNLEMSTPFTLQAGQIDHLCTTFDFELPEKGLLTALVEELHPTPAVCGIPTEKAEQLIRQFEKHDRGYYTGFLGPINHKGHTALYVNLRCMKITSQQMILYTGGGITRNSNPESEWEETEMKARTLLSVIEKMRNLAP